MSRINSSLPNPLDPFEEGRDGSDRNAHAMGGRMNSPSNRNTHTNKSQSFHQISNPHSAAHGIPLLPLPLSAPNLLSSHLLSPTLPTPTTHSPKNRVPFTNSLVQPYESSDGDYVGGGDGGDVINDVSASSSRRIREGGKSPSIRKMGSSSIRRGGSHMLREIAKEVRGYTTTIPFPFPHNRNTP